MRHRLFMTARTKRMHTYGTDLYLSLLLRLLLRATNETVQDLLAALMHVRSIDRYRSGITTGRINLA